MKKNKFSLALVLTFTLLFTLNTNSQTVYETLEHGIHKFLDRMNIKQLVQVDSEVKPYTRKYIAQKLLELMEQRNKLSKVQQEELDWYIEEYSYEIEKEIKKDSQYSNLSTQLSKRWRLFSYEDSLFQMQVSPVAGYEVSNLYGASAISRWWGIRAFGSYSDWFGAHLHFTDNGEFGDNIDKEKSFSPVKGAETIDVKNGIEYSDVRGSINFEYQWASLSLIKDYFTWGNAKNASVIISEKAPSYTHIRLTLKPTDWFRFYYTHGWLHSGVLDSTKFYVANVGTLLELRREQFIEKFYAANLFTFMPTDWLDVSIGNSIIYSGDNIRPEMLIPFMFFKYLDRDGGKGNIEDGNGAIHTDLLVKYPENFSFYWSFFLDVTQISNILKNDFNNTWFGYTVGAKAVDLGIPNLDVNLEYTLVNPWVYEHKDPTTTYKHLDYSLGHWIGQNADQLRFQIDYQPIRGLHINTYYERVRKGGLLDIYYGYVDQAREPFLYGPVRKDNIFGLNVKYEILHEFTARASFRYSDITDEDPDRTPDYLLGTNSSVSFSVSYGFK